MQTIVRSKLDSCAFAIAVCGLFLCWSSLTFGQEPSSPNVKRRMLVVLGAPGEPGYAQEFRKWSDEWKSAVGEQDFQRIDGTTAAQPEGSASTNDRSELLNWIAGAKENSAAEHWLIFIGHGTFDSASAKFNLRGPDIEAKELGKAIETVGGRWVIINCASSSGPFIDALSGTDRIIVTATKSGAEHNYARFGQFFAQAIHDPSADLDHDHGVSVLEAFLSASGKVAEFYRSDDRLASEQSLLDDNGDKRGTPAAFYRGVRPVKAPADGLQLDGARANRVYLADPSHSKQLSLEQEQRRRELESQVEQLRKDKSKFGEDDYYQRLEVLFSELARL